MYDGTSNVDGLSRRGSMTTYIGVDIGGTFTDVVLCQEDGEIVTRKVISTVEDYARGVLDAVSGVLDEASLEADSVGEVNHATTIASNAILQRSGGLTGLLTTEGFRDVLELARMRIPEMYNLLYTKPNPLVERFLRRGVIERIRADGSIAAPLDENQAIREIEFLVGRGVESIAICLLHSYANDIHERRLGELVRVHHPEIFCSLSCDVIPEAGEYERTSTTVINGYVQPAVARYLASLRVGLDTINVRAPLLVMQSSGGLMSSQRAVERAVHIVESGPAAGVIAGRETAREAREPNCITFDMGGTTAKASVIEDDEVHLATEYEVGGELSAKGGPYLGGAGFTLKVPAIDIAEVGTGGGSIASVDSAGALSIGPQSAGASPGPACYGLGGTRATVTDANVHLGYISQSAIAGGAVTIHADRAKAVVTDHVAGPMDLDADGAAWAIHAVANSRMIGAIKAVTTQRGRDPRDFVIMAFGGSGPLHAVGVAQMLKISEVIVPRAPGVFSAFGLLRSERQHYHTRSFFARLSDIDQDQLREAFRRLEGVAFEEFAEEGGRHLPVTLSHAIDLRYTGQGHELTVALSMESPPTQAVDRLRQAFSLEHQRRYGYCFTDQEIEIIALRVTATLARLAVSNRNSSFLSPALAGKRIARPAYFHGFGRVSTPVIPRHQLSLDPTAGPLIVEETDATTLVPPSCLARLDPAGNIRITVDTADAI